MPRININEKDRTSPGTPGGYSNNTVLIAGFSAYTDKQIQDNVAAKKAIAADDNGIFEFVSADDFVNTIGLVPPTMALSADDTVDAYKTYSHELPAHYGNQMAYELLNMGYPIIYINLGTTYENKYKEDTEGKLVFDHTEIVIGEKMKKLGDEATWKVFKDKASYDFRFISHGLLTSSHFVKSDDLVKFEKRVAKMQYLIHSKDDSLNEFKALWAADKDGSITTEEDRAKLGEYIEQLPVLDPKTGEQVTDENGQLVFRNEEYDEIIARLKLAAIKEVFDAESSFMFGTTTSKLTDAAVEIGYISAFIKEGVAKKLSKIDSQDYQYDLGLSVVEDAELELARIYNLEVGKAFTDTDFDKANKVIANLAHYKAEISSDGSEDEMAITSGRGDCVALIEVNEATYNLKNSDRPETNIVNAINNMSYITNDNGKYCACTVPSVTYKMTADTRFNENRKFPGAFHYLACFKNSLGLGFAEWYAAAGYTRGISSYNIDFTTVKLGEIAIQALEPRNRATQAAPSFAVNVIANFRGSYYLWGNRTCHPLGMKESGSDLIASHFLNIRQLCTTIKKQLYVSCRRFTFDPNSDTLWINFKNSITPMLERMKADQGVRDFRIEKVYTDKKATLKAKIRIVPIEAVEDFLLEVSLEDSLGETAVTVTE